AELISRCLAKDPGQRPQSGRELLQSLEILPNFADTTFVDVSERATNAARRALALDSTLSEAHMSLALSFMHAFRWAEDDLQFQRAIATDPDDAAAHMQYGRFLVYTGRSQEALTQMRRAKELDPTSALISSWFASSLLSHGMRDEAFAEIDRALEIDSMNPPIIFFGSHVMAARGDMDAARRLLDRAPPLAVWRSAAAQAYAAMGDHDAVRRLSREVEASTARSFRHSALAGMALALNDAPRALDEFERAMRAKEFWPSAPILSTPIVDQIRRSPRFEALLRQAGLNVAIFTSPTGGRPAP
ncbi:MAG: protein kinase family protein, partial [Vicinamibacterales bacterium]